MGTSISINGSRSTCANSGSRGELKISTATKKMATVKAFFRYLESNRWLKENPANFLKEKHTRKEREGENAPRIPFSDDDLTRMFSACASQYAAKGNYRRRWVGQDLADFIAVSVYTGLRISDLSARSTLIAFWRAASAISAPPRNGKKVFTHGFRPGCNVGVIRARANDIRGPLIFGTHHNNRYLCRLPMCGVQLLADLWDLCGPWPEKGQRLHRFPTHLLPAPLKKANVTVR